MVGVVTLGATVAIGAGNDPLLPPPQAVKTNTTVAAINLGFKFIELRFGINMTSVDKTRSATSCFERAPSCFTLGLIQSLAKIFVKNYDPERSPW